MLLSKSQSSTPLNGRRRSHISLSTMFKACGFVLAGGKKIRTTVDKDIYRRTRRLEIDAQSVGVATVMFDEICECWKRDTTSDEKTSFVELTNAVMFHCVTVADCHTTSQHDMK